MGTGVQIFRSTDGSAPSLSGTAGDLTNLLDKVLADGYGSVSSAGWSKAYTATNRRAYRPPAGGNQFYLRVRDDAGGTGGAKEALLRGFETMSDVNTGTGPFPTSGQSALTDNSLVARKSTTADATTRAWVAAADNRTLHLFVLSGDVASSYACWSFGDFYSLLPGDGYRTALMARAAENSGTAANEKSDTITSSTTGYMVGLAGFYVPRSYTGLGGSINAGRHGDIAKGNNSGLLNGTVQFPNGPDGGIYLSPVWVHDGSSGTVRGRMRGFHHFCHAIAGVADGDTFSGTGDYAGKSFLVVKQSMSAGLYAVETSDTWETSS